MAAEALGSSRQDGDGDGDGDGADGWLLGQGVGTGPGAPRCAGVEALSSAGLGDKITTGGGREGFLTGTLWEKQNLMSWFTNCPPNDIPEGAGQAS